MIADIVILLIMVVYVMVLLISLGGLLTWVERKQGAVMADRIGANRCYLPVPFTDYKIVWWGLFHGIADGLKMITKEDFHPDSNDKFAYALAPWLCIIPVLLAFAVIPFGGQLIPSKLFGIGDFLEGIFGDKSYFLQIAKLDAGLLVIFAVGGLGVIGTILAGWSSNNKFSFMGGLRASAQMISYEVSMGLSLLGLVVVFGSVDLDQIVREQSGLIFGVLPRWGFFLQPFAFILFLTTAMAENKRAPFDLPECESELVCGYFTEYNAMKMGLFMFGEFIEIVVISAILTTLFFGGYNLPYLSDAGFSFPFGYTLALSHTSVLILQLITFVVKIMVLCSFQIQIRWTLPRFRYDQLMGFGWKFLLPLAMINLVGSVIYKWLVTM
ncbi:complex I subunit 1 family protein [Deltaproteobacteria bacterium TL4]